MGRLTVIAKELKDQRSKTVPKNILGDIYEGLQKYS
jgi:hypothetical protein